MMNSKISIRSVPLVVDLDGTLIKTDLLIETASQFLLTQPWRFFTFLSWLAAGKCKLKEQLAAQTKIDVSTLPYNETLLAKLKQEKSQGRTLILATASNIKLAQRVADHLQLFDVVLASDAQTNLKSQAKCAALVQRYGPQLYDYIGNNSEDFAVWQAAAQAHIVSDSHSLIDTLRQQGNLGYVIPTEKQSVFKSVVEAIRPHQWMKNLLVFVPMLAAHQYGNAASVQQGILAFIIFSLTASSVYVLNDLVDVGNDRHHARKRFRPLAAGQLSLLQGWVIWPLLLISAFTFAINILPSYFVSSLAAYFVLTVTYSLWLKQIPIMDVLTLSGLYTLRIISGAAAIDAPLTFWMLLFSMFLFLSLASIKRFSELKTARINNQSSTLRGRGYSHEDLELVANLGISAGYMGVLVLAFYIHDVSTANLYATPQYLWFACPLMLYWISRAWIIAHRGEMHDDPIVFALKDGISWGMTALFVAIFALAKVTVV
jgi:4-hydroxybenzoate polyprenyltransferase